MIGDLKEELEFIVMQDVELKKLQHSQCYLMKILNLLEMILMHIK
jgi:hypothetical protein